jgi:hypothetical protein
MSFTSLFNLEPHIEFNKKSESQETEEKSAAPVAEVQADGSAVAAAPLDLDKLFIVILAVALVVLSSAALVYAARH